MNNAQAKALQIGDVLQHTRGKLYRVYAISQRDEQGAWGVVPAVTLREDGTMFIGVVGQRNGKDFGRMRNFDATAMEAVNG